MSEGRTHVKDVVQAKLDSYNNEQRAAVRGILDKWDSEDGEFVFPIVDGPPGTGKTSVGTVAAAEYLLENRKAEVAYLAYTHFAVAKAQEDLHSYGFPTDKIVELHYNSAIRDWNRGTYGCDSDVELPSFEDRRRLKECGVLLCTLHSSKRVFKLHTRPKIIIDEFSQVSPPLFFSVLQKIQTSSNPEGYALLGDPIQLPVISTQSILRPNIGIFLLQRKPHDPHRLEIQYRMHEDICEAVNSLRAVYGAKRIETGTPAKERDLIGLGYSYDKTKVPAEFLEIIDPSKPLTIVNTDRFGPEDRILGGSIMNGSEADLAVRLFLALDNALKDKGGKHLGARELKILSPYAAQVGEIRRLLPEERRDNCITIYRSQGREYPCVIISFVRNNDLGSIGFLGQGSENDLREQTYVGCSRAQAKLIVLLSFRTFLGRGHTEFEALAKTRNAQIIDRS